MATTRSRSRGREHARPSSGGVIAENTAKIWTAGIISIVIIVAFLALTSTGHVIDAATQHFMLYYAGVFALIALCASVGLGLVATDRIFLNPGHRVLVQAAHRAVSFGALAFLIVHIITEILAQRVHVLDAVVPFLSPFRTFYIGIGTIASDLVILLVITSIIRSRFTAHGKAKRWRIIHYMSYAAFVFGVWHSLLGGRAAKPYVDWSYGFVVAFVAGGVVVRFLATSLRPKENLSAPPGATPGSSATAPLRAAAALAQSGRPGTGSQPRLVVPSTAQPVLSAPVADGATRQFPASALTAAGGPGDGEAARQPYYEPGYEGPVRYLGAPTAQTGPLPRAATGPMPRAATGPLPRAATGPMPRAATGPMPRADAGPLGRPPTGPIPRATGPIPRATGPVPRATGPVPRATGPIPQAGPGPVASPAPGQVPPPGTARPRGGRQSRDGSSWAAGNGGGGQDQPPWDSAVPGADPAFRYRDPGPGMPGYPGSRENRHGGDRRW